MDAVLSTQERLSAAYDHFREVTRPIWEGQDRELTSEECEQHAAATAELFGLDWRWEDGEDGRGLVFSARPN